MSDDRDHTIAIATATVTSEETPYGVRIRTTTGAARPVATRATERPRQWGVLIP